MQTLIVFNRNDKFEDAGWFIDRVIEDREIVRKQNNPIFRITLEDGNTIVALPYCEEYFDRSIRGYSVDKVVFTETFMMEDVRNIMEVVMPAYISGSNQGVYMGDMKLGEWK